MYQLGKQAKDKVTGFEGILTSKHHYLTGCNQYAIQPRVDEKGIIPEPRYFDEGRIEITGAGIDIQSVLATENGCDKREYPTKS